jgi:hypothetical protein
MGASNRVPLLTLLIALAAGTLTGFVLTELGGEGHPANNTFRDTRHRSIKFPAEIEQVRLPVGARHRRDIKSFLISLEETIDDFAQVFVNDYLLFTSEGDIFFRGVNKDEKNPPDIDLTEWFKRKNRVNQTFRRYDVSEYLKPGLNTIVFQLFNSRLGGCHTRGSIVVNNEVLEGFPRYFPETRFPGVTRLLSDRFDVVIRDSIAKKSDDYTRNISEETDAVCARRIFAFTLY